MTNTDTETRLVKAALFGHIFTRARNAGISWRLIAEGYAMKRKEVKDLVGIYRHIHEEKKSHTSIPPYGCLSHKAAQLPKSTPGTIEYSRDTGLTFCLSTRDFYYERQNAPDLPTLLQWEREALDAMQDGTISEIPSTIYYSN